MTTFKLPAPARDHQDVSCCFEEIVRQVPMQTAIVHNGVDISYHELAQRVRRASTQYLADGDRTVGALVSHTPAAAVHLLAALWAGATYCPVDAATPNGRRLMLADVLGLDAAALIAVDDVTTDFGAESPRVECDPDTPAYLLCTSGSTGTPKPVVVSRRALAATAHELRQLFGLRHSDRVLQFASLAWDTCLEEMVPALTAGATLVFDDAAFCASFPSFLRMLARRRVTVVDLPTAFWHEMVLFLHEEGAALPESLRLVVIGGERVDPTRLRQWRALDVGHVRLLNTYGCTETTMVTHAVQLAGHGTDISVAQCDTDVPMGRALPHVHDQVSDDGELWVSGTCLSSGYRGLPEVTAAAFRTVDDGTEPVTWFRTGDLVTRTSDGLLHSLGRLDDQVKVLGVRVHPAEVEMQLNSHPAVTGAVVVGERQLDRVLLRAYVVVAQPVTALELKQYLRERLPSQFVPNSLKFVAALKYTSTGKVDRAATQRAVNCLDGKGEIQ